MKEIEKKSVRLKIDPASKQQSTQQLNTTHNTMTLLKPYSKPTNIETIKKDLKAYWIDILYIDVEQEITEKNIEKVLDEVDENISGYEDDYIHQEIALNNKNHFEWFDSITMTINDFAEFMNKLDNQNDIFKDLKTFHHKIITYCWFQLKDEIKEELKDIYWKMR